MTQNRQTIVILCEDKQQYLFARYFFQKKGCTGQFVAKVCPSGKQSGEQYVREHYAAEVKGYRSQKNRKKICLVVVIDADTVTVTERIRQLEMTLQEKRQSKENIAIFVPKRNIETWIHYLQSGETIDEIVAYSKLANQGECKPFVEKLVDHCVQGLPSNAPLSMHDACMELKRIIE